MNRVLVGTAGHIDHGKSALVRALTGTDPDRLPEEKERGITIDLGFAHAAWDGVVFSFVDVPGHERFVKTMVAGAQGIDVALLVVASDDAVMPQTREHLAILSLLDVRAGLVVRTKSDLVDEETGALVEDEIQNLVKGTFLQGAPLVAVSSTTGAGIEDLKRALSALAASAAGRERAARPARLFVDRAFAMKGFGPVVTGTLDGGRVRPEDRLVLFPEGLEVRVRRVEVHGEERREARAGERTSLNLAGVEKAALRRGQTLVSPGSIAPSSILTVEIETLATSPPLLHGTRVRLHHGTTDLFAKVALLAAEDVDGKSSLAPGSRAFAQLFCESKVPAWRGDRFVLRRPSPVETWGGGRVLDTGRDRMSRREDHEGVRRILSTGTDLEVVALFLKEAGPRGLEAASLGARLGLSPSDAAIQVDTLARRGEAIRLAPSLFVSSAAVAQMVRRTEAIFSDWKASGAVSATLDKSEFLSRLGRGLSPGVAESWLATLAAARKLVLLGDRVGPPGAAAATVADEASGFAARIAERYASAGFDPPRSLDVAKSLGTKPAVVDGLVSHLLKTGVLVRLSPDLVVHGMVVEGAVSRLEVARGRTMSVGEFRDFYGLSRKSLIPLLEHLDRLKKTRRVGDARVVL